MKGNTAIRLDNGCSIVQKNRLRMEQVEREMEVKKTK